MKRIPLKRITLTLLLAGSLTGCLRFGPDTVNSKPTPEQVARCRERLGINPALEITPLGYKAVYGIDDAVWFKFSCKTEQAAAVSWILRRPQNAKVLHGEGPGNLPEEIGASWWNLAEKQVT